MRDEIDFDTMLNWLSQVVSVTLFNLRTIPERKGAAIAAAVGIAGVVAVFVGVLSIAAGFPRGDDGHRRRTTSPSCCAAARTPK